MSSHGNLFAAPIQPFPLGADKIRFRSSWHWMAAETDPINASVMKWNGTAIERESEWAGNRQVSKFRRWDQEKTWKMNWNMCQRSAPKIIGPVDWLPPASLPESQESQQRIPAENPRQESPSQEWKPGSITKQLQTGARKSVIISSHLTSKPQESVRIPRDKLLQPCNSLTSKNLQVSPKR